MKTRTITAAILIAIFLPVCIIGGPLFYAAIALIIGGGIFELFKAREGTGDSFKWPAYIKIIGIVMGLLMFMWPELINVNTFGIKEFMKSAPFVYFPILPFTILFLLMFCGVISDEKISVPDACYIIAMITFLAIAGQCVVYVREGTGNGNINAFIFVLLSCVINDTGAYFVGCKFGKHRLNERISPKKSIEGLIGGFVLGAIITTVFGLWILPINIEWYFVVLISLILAVTGPIGDLIFSAIKRHYGVKDYSNLLPGHGGVLDRVDSILINICVFAVLYMAITSGSIFF